MFACGSSLEWADSELVEILVTRDDKKESSLKSFLKTTGFRVLMAIGVFVVLNVVVITVHHIAQKVSRSTSLYKSIDHIVSPF